MPRAHSALSIVPKKKIYIGEMKKGRKDTQAVESYKERIFSNVRHFVFISDIII